jgi:predicted esterase
MRSGNALFLATLLVLPACGSSDEGPEGAATGGVSGTGGLGTGSTPVTGGSGGGVATGGSANGGGIASGGITGSGGLAAGGGPDTGSGGFPPGSGGEGPGTGGAPPASGGADPGGGTATGGAPPTGGAQAKIPEPTGACPDFKSGTQTIMGLSTNIVAGAPQAKKGPLLFTWHGTGGNGTQALGQLPKSVQQDITAQGGIVIAASDNGQVREGQDVTFVLGVWYDKADLAFADQIVACAVKNNNIDPNQIFVTGCSAGGLMTGVMTMERSTYVASSAPNSGGLPVATFPVQDKAHVPPVFCMHGGSKDNVVINFGDASRTLETEIVNAGGVAVDCNHNIGHCGAPAALHEKAWQFMKMNPFNVGTSPFKAGIPAGQGFPDYCRLGPVPASETK